MALIKPKRGTTTPTISNLVTGEIAVDTAAQKIYINDAGTIKLLANGLVETEIDGGFANSIYTATQTTDGGFA